jgi:hypothetical protein
MDKRLEKALEYSNLRMILSTRQENLKVLMNNKLKLQHGGGTFKATPDFLSFVSVLVAANTKEIILLDLNDTPIQITDIDDFGKKLVEKYRSATEQYYNSYQKLSEMRDMRKVVNWDEPFKEE